jgi:hypothetical protein
MAIQANTNECNNAIDLAGSDEEAEEAEADEEESEEESEAEEE